MLSELQVIGMSALPIVELRGAIPLGIAVYSLPPLEVFFLAIVGNLLPVMFILTFLPYIETYTKKRFSWGENFFSWWYARIYKKHKHILQKWGPVALITLVAIPLPMTGAYTGAVAAYLFKIPKRQAFWYVTIGVIIAGMIVTGLTVTGKTFL